MVQSAEVLSFDSLITIYEEDTYLQKVVYTAINWLNTNKFGMAFGLFFAALLLTIIHNLPSNSFSSRHPLQRFFNACKGLFIGAPLGVCVNCAAPIGLGMLHKGVRTEIALTTMISAPTLNIVVLTMLFTLFPLHFIVAKIACTLLLLLACVPFITHTLNMAPIHQSEHVFTYLPTHESWRDALLSVLATTFNNLIFILKKTLPLMLLAGILGALVIESIPLDSFSGLELSLLSLAGIALIGTFLPVPIALDIILVYGLLRAGLNPGLAMTLLFTLGAFSIYPFMLLWQQISKKLALMLAVSVILLGMGVGVIVDQYHQWQVQSIIAAYDSNIDQLLDATKTE